MSEFPQAEPNEYRRIAEMRRMLEDLEMWWEDHAVTRREYESMKATLTGGIKRAAARLVKQERDAEPTSGPDQSTIEEKR
jgi:hypothetical protein